jgi:hypothetical protein
MRLMLRDIAITSISTQSSMAWSARQGLAILIVSARGGSGDYPFKCGGVDKVGGEFVKYQNDQGRRSGGMRTGNQTYCLLSHAAARSAQIRDRAISTPLSPCSRLVFGNLLVLPVDL